MKERKHTMKNFVSIFEIPATDIKRAIGFYATIMDMDIEFLDFPGMQLGLFPVDDQINFGTIALGTPSADGVTIYLNGGDNLQVILDRVETEGGKVLVPKSQHADESGYFALFLDSEGNKLGLHSPN